MKSLKHFLIGVVSVLAPVIPLIAANPSVRHYIAQHPAIAAYLPLVSGVVVEIFHRLIPTFAPAPTPPVPPK